MDCYGFRVVDRPHGAEIRGPDNLCLGVGGMTRGRAKQVLRRMLPAFVAAGGAVAYEKGDEGAVAKAALAALAVGRRELGMDQQQATPKPPPTRFPVELQAKVADVMRRPLRALGGA